MLNLILIAVFGIVEGFIALFFYERGYKTGQTKQVQPIKLPKIEFPIGVEKQPNVDDECMKVMSYTGDLPKRGVNDGDDNGKD